MTRPLIFLSRLAQVDALHEQRPDLLREGRLIALDLDVAARLHALKYDYEEMTALISPLEADALRQEAVQLAQTWHHGWSEDAVYAGFSLPPLDCFGVSWFFTEALIARSLFHRVVARGRPSTLVLVDVPRKPTVWGTAAPDVAHAVWRYLAEQHNLPVMTLTAASAPAPASKRSAGLRRVLAVGWDILRNPLLWQMLPGLRRRCNVLMIVYYLEASRLDALAEYLTQQLGGQFARLTMDTLHKMQFPESRSAWQPLPTFRPLWDRFFARRKLQKVYARWLEQRQSEQTSYPELFANPHLYGKFKHYIVTRLAAAAEIAALTSRLLAAYQPRVVVTTSGAISQQPALLAAAVRYGVRVVTLPHSGTPTHPDITMLGDQAVVWTQDFVRWWSGAGLDANRLAVVGMPKAVVYHGYRQEGVLPPAPQTEKVLLVLLSVATNDLIAYVDMQAHYEALLAVANLPVHLQGKVRVIFKVHPGTDYKYFYEHVRSQSPSPDSVTIIKKTPLKPLLQIADAALLVNMPSSSYLLPLLEGIPLLYLRTTDLPGVDFAFAEWGGAAIIPQVQDVWEVLEQTLYAESYREMILADNRAFWARMSPTAQHDPFATIHDLVIQYLNRTTHD